MRLLQAANEVRISDRSRQVERGLSKIVKLNYTGLAKKVIQSVNFLTIALAVSFSFINQLRIEVV